MNKEKRETLKLLIEESVSNALGCNTKSAVNISDNTISMYLEADGATQELARAITAQAAANQATAEAIKLLAATLKPIDVSAIKIESLPDIT